MESSELLRDQAAANVAKWGDQDLPTLGLVAAEEMGELAQAILSWVHEGGDRDRIREEAIDLGAVCLQVLRHFDCTVDRLYCSRRNPRDMACS